MAGQYSNQDRSAQDSSRAPSYPEPSQATTVLVLGLLGMLVFPPLAPFAWAMGTQELRAVDAGRRSPENRQLARVGQVLGAVMSLLLILFVVLVFGLVLISI